jgi:hypothetical protein
MTIIKASYELRKADVFIRETLFVSRNWRLIRRQATSETTQNYQSEIYDWIRSQGLGTWPDFHPMSKKMVYEPSKKTWTKRKRRLGRTNYNWLMQFVKSRVNRAGTFARVRFGSGKTTEARRLETRAIWVEGGHKTTVDDKHRRLWGATREAAGTSRKRQKPGVNFFPLKKETTTIEIEERPIMEPVYKRENRKVPVWYSDFLQDTVDRYKKGKVR